MNNKIQKAIDTEMFDEAVVRSVLANVLVFGEIDHIISHYDASEINLICKHFCRWDGENDKWHIHAKFLPIQEGSLWKSLIQLLKDNHGFTNQGVPPRVFDFNIYEKTANAESTLQRIVLSGFTITHCARIVAKYYLKDQFPTTLGKYVENRLETNLAFEDGVETKTVRIKGLIG